MSLRLSLISYLKNNKINFKTEYAHGIYLRFNTCESNGEVNESLVDRFLNNDFKYPDVSSKNEIFKWFSFAIKNEPNNYDNLIDFILKFQPNKKSEEYFVDYQQQIIRLSKDYQPFYCKLLNNQKYIISNYDKMNHYLDNVFSQDNKINIVNSMIKSKYFTNLEYQKKVQVIIDAHIKNKDKFKDVCYKIEKPPVNLESFSEHGDYMNIVYNIKNIGMLNISKSVAGVKKILLSVHDLKQIQEKLGIREIYTINKTDNENVELLILGESLNKKLIITIANEYIKENMVNINNSSIEFIESLYSKALAGNLSDSIPEGVRIKSKKL